MSRIIEATTAAEYFSLCNELACDQLDLFRGQTNNYPKIIPSLYRTTTVGEESHDSIIRLFVNCYRLGSYEIIKEKYIDNINESYGQGRNKGFESWDSFYEFVELIQALPGGDDLNYKREDFIWGVISSLEMNWDRHGDALLQHYGIPSRALDVSYKPLLLYGSPRTRSENLRTAQLPMCRGARASRLCMSSPAPELRLRISGR